MLTNEVHRNPVFFYFNHKTIGVFAFSDEEIENFEKNAQEELGGVDYKRCDFATIDFKFNNSVIHLNKKPSKSPFFVSAVHLAGRTYFPIDRKMRFQFPEIFEIEGFYISPEEIVIE